MTRAPPDRPQPTFRVGWAGRGLVWSNEALMVCVAPAHGVDASFWLLSGRLLFEQRPYLCGAYSASTSDYHRTIVTHPAFQFQFGAGASFATISQQVVGSLALTSVAIFAICGTWPFDCSGARKYNWGLLGV